MARITAKNASQQAFIPVMRELVRAYQAFESTDTEQLRKYNLTSPQADVIFTLGNTNGMSFKEIGNRALITKGTLTGVIDRLVDKCLVERIPCESDRRKMIVKLTDEGQDLFNNAFPKHISYLKDCFDGLTVEEMYQAEKILNKIRNLF